jgi:hypothetical protein
MRLGGSNDPPTPMSLAGFQVFGARRILHTSATRSRLKTGQRFFQPAIPATVQNLQESITPHFESEIAHEGAKTPTNSSRRFPRGQTRMRVSPASDPLNQVSIFRAHFESGQTRIQTETVRPYISFQRTRLRMGEPIIAIYGALSEGIFGRGEVPSHENDYEDTESP